MGLLRFLLLPALLASCPSSRPEPHSDLSARLILTPRLSIAPLHLSAQALILDPQAVLHCPTFAWDWGDGTVSLAFNGCLENGLPRRATIPTTHVYRLRGEYFILFTASDGVHTCSSREQVGVY
jgi:hypothetical protein